MDLESSAVYKIFYEEQKHFCYKIKIMIAIIFEITINKLISFYILEIKYFAVK